ncbi:autophagy protein atg9 [Sorochytrium milnesiophthora]
MSVRYHADIAHETSNERMPFLAAEASPVAAANEHTAAGPTGGFAQQHVDGAEIDLKRSIFHTMEEAEPEYDTASLPPQERAIAMWKAVSNVDVFLDQVYRYYYGKGMHCILLSRTFQLFRMGFVVAFSVFLSTCIDYGKLERLHEPLPLRGLIKDQCPSVHPFLRAILLLAGSAWAWQFARLVRDIRPLRDMYDFYTHALDIPDSDIQTTPWPVVVKRITDLSERHPLRNLPAITVHDITNRLMRRDNYLVAMFNKDVFDLRVRVPLLAPNGNSVLLTKIVQWNLLFCVMGSVFDADGHLKREYTRASKRQELINGLRARILIMAVLNALFAPFVAVFLVLYFFFRYGEEYYRNPGNLGSRRYSPLARWRLREFNELPHLFQYRLNASHSKALLYLGQFPAERTAILVRFLTFIVGSVAGVLVLISLIYPDSLIHLELTPERTPIFYIGVLGSVLAVTRAMATSSDPDAERYDTALLMRDVIKDTHYYPEHWVDKLHTVAVRTEFGAMFQYRLVLYAHEFASVLLTPFVLWQSLAPCAPRIVDFFRDFTVHVDNVGYVCSFAVFDFQRHGNIKYGAPAAEHLSERYVSQQGKMEKSFVNFKAMYPDWDPSLAGSTYLSRLAQVQQQTNTRRSSTNNDAVPFGVSSILDMVGNGRRVDVKGKGPMYPRTRVVTAPSATAGQQQRRDLLTLHGHLPPVPTLLDMSPSAAETLGVTPAVATAAGVMDQAGGGPSMALTTPLPDYSAQHVVQEGIVHYHHPDDDDNDSASSTASDPDMIREDQQQQPLPTEASLFGMLDATYMMGPAALHSSSSTAAAAAAAATTGASAHKEKVCLIGSGNWGSAIAKIVGHNVRRHSDLLDSEVKMWVFDEKVDGRSLVDIINERHENVKYLPGIALPDNVKAVADIVESARDATVLVFVVPHQFVKSVCAQLHGKIRPDAKAISLIKGVDASQAGLTLISDLIKQNLGVDVSVLMGANIANEVAEENFCETTIGYSNKTNADLMFKVFHTPYFRVNTVEDVAGVEICGALKNIVALGAGFIDGLKYGDNTKAAIIRLGLLEMRKFAKTFYSGVRDETFMESCGVADLITTCAGGRNRKIAEAMVTTGKPLDVLERELLNGQKAQGTLTAKEVYEILVHKDLVHEFPLMVTIYRISFEGLPPQNIVKDI